MYLIYVPLIAVFAAFVIYAGVVMPAMEIVESLKNRRRSRAPDNVVELHRPAQRREAA
ncbi:hypothetical protein [Actinomadura darangshiensis]|uniref:hypothetical protein n=1 Tax=Actinomadura darangshiensis TaxID=705336 RepID=UPI001407C7AF|nr:hypothetical protein [Actinomadura darangshiensis]